jgi:hypothetical protein
LVTLLALPRPQRAFVVWWLGEIREYAPPFSPPSAGPNLTTRLLLLGSRRLLAAGRRLLDVVLLGHTVTPFVVRVQTTV